MKSYRYSSLERIDKEGLSFSDGFSFSFSDCAAGFKKHCGHFSNASDCVAERNILARPPHFRFYLDGDAAEIVFDCKGLFAGKRSERLFLEFQRKIASLGYKTFDLT